MNGEHCPDSDLLRDFRLGIPLASEQSKTLATHIEFCPVCLAAYQAIVDPLGKKLKEAAAQFEPLTTKRVTDSMPPMIPGFGPLKELGRGGMGIVYKAQEPELKRVVAIKLIGDRWGDTATRARFKVEAQALAAIIHPHVVRIYHFGEANGRPYLVMEYLEGNTLTTRIDEYVVDQTKAAQLILKVARGVQEAHNVSIIHRDLKPGNILFDGQGDPKVTDFGNAKRVHGEDQTGTGVVVGTPAYMAPEQVAGKTKFVTPALDVWALGVILYECLMGCVPFIGESERATLKLIEDQDPVKPRTLKPTISRDLETICLKCLEKDPIERYESAAALAEDLDNWVQGKPIKAKRPGFGKRFRLWVRRHPAMAALSFLVLLVGSAGGGVAYSEWDKRQAAEFAQKKESGLRQKAVEAQAKTRDVNTTLVTDRGVIAIGRSNPTAAIFHLISALELAPADHEDQHRYLRTALASAYDSLHRLENMLLLSKEIRATAGSPDGRLIASVDASGLLQVHDLMTGKSREKPIRPDVLPEKKTDLSLGAVSFTPDGGFVVTASNGGQIYKINAKTLSQSPLGEFPGSPRALSVTPDGKMVVVGGIGAGDRQQLAKYNLAGDEKPAKFSPEVTGQVDAVAFSPNGRYFATSGRGNDSLTLWDVEKNIEFPPIPHAGRIFAITFSPDGSKVVTGCIDCNIRFWNTKTQIADGLPLRHSHPVRALAYHTSEEGEFLLSAAEDGTSQVWDIGLRVPIGQPLYHVGNTRGVAFCSDKGITRLITTGFDRVIRVWRLRPSATVTTLPHPAGVTAITFDPKSGHILTGCRDAVQINQDGIMESVRGAVRLWEQTQSGRWTVRRKFDQHGEALAIGLGGNVILGGGNDGNARLWNLDGTTHKLLPHSDEKNANKVIYSAAITSDGRYVAFAGQSSQINLLDRHGESRKWVGPDTGWVWTVAFSPDHTRLLTDGRSGIRLWDVKNGAMLPKEMKLEGDDEVRWSTFSPTGTYILGCGFSEGHVSVWDAGGNLVSRYAGKKGEQHQGQVYMGAFDPHEEIIATAGADHTVRVWEVKTGKLKYLIAHEGKVLAVAFSPDGQSLVTGCEDGTVRIWSSKSGVWEGPILHHQGAVTRVVYLPDLAGKRQLLTASNDGTARVWTMPAPIEGSPSELRTKFEIETGMTTAFARKPGDNTDQIRSDEGLLRILGEVEWKKLKEGK